MMGIMVPETCWASNNICNKKHLFHVVGILFPHSISQLCGTVGPFQTLPNSAEFLPKVILAHGSLIKERMYYVVIPHKQILWIILYNIFVF
jgi:hypothetical protein